MDPTEPREDDREPTKAEILEAVRDQLEMVRNGRFDPTGSDLSKVIDSIVTYLEAAEAKKKTAKALGRLTMEG